MDPKTILVHVAPGQGRAAHVRAAADLAATFGAELLGVGSEAFRPERDLALSHLDGLQIAQIRKRIDSELEEARIEFARCAGDQRHSWTRAYDDPDDLLVRHAARADLIVAASSIEAGSLRAVAETEDIILESGLPVIVTPPDHDHVSTVTILLAWKNTKEARRAVGDALPFLKRAKSVRAVSVCEEETRGDTDAELKDVVARLSQHGVSAEAEAVVASCAAAGEVVWEIAHARRVDLVVAGAYGRSRARQRIFGGVTRHLLKHPDKPVLFSR